MGSIGKHYEKESKGDVMASTQMSIVKSCKNVQGSRRKSSLPTLPLIGRWGFSRLLLGVFLELVRFFVRESKRTVVKPHERLAWIRHLGRSAGERGIRFAVFISIRNALIIIVISDRVKNLTGKSFTYNLPSRTLLTTVTWRRNRGGCVRRGAGV